jgi:hypothetical protein
VAEQLATTMNSILALPGFEASLRMPKFSDAVAALGAGDALVYLVTSPDGSLAFVVTDGRDGGDTTGGGANSEIPRPPSPVRVLHPVHGPRDRLQTWR